MLTYQKTEIADHAISYQNVNRIIIVDDEINILNSLKRLLNDENYELITTTSGNSALAIMDAKPVSVVISDQKMPQMSGVELMEAIAEKHPDTVRILLSSYTEIDIVLEAINQGSIFKYITKPWEDEKIKLDIRIANEQYNLKRKNKLMAEKILRQNEILNQLNSDLTQQFWDVSSGFKRIQDLIEHIDAAVIMIDNDGLIVGANSNVQTYLNLDSSGILGIPGIRVIPAALFDPFTADSPGCSHGELELNNTKIFWKKKCVTDDDIVLGTLITIWRQNY